MANEASIINNPDSTPGDVSTGYQLQNTGFIAQRNGVDCTVVEAYATNQVKVKISGPVDVNGVLYEIDTEATLTISATGTYVVYLAGSGNNLTPTLLNTTTSFGTWDDSKNARYYSSQRVLNWIIDCTLGSTPTVYRWLYTKDGGFVYDDFIVSGDLTIEGDIIGDNTITGSLTVEDSTDSSSKDTGAIVASNGGIGAELNIQNGGYLKSGLGRWPTGFYHDSGITRGDIYSQLSAIIPNVGDRIIVNGIWDYGASVTGIISYAVRSSSSQITLYYGVVGGSITGGQCDSGSSAAVNFISIAW